MANTIPISTMDIPELELYTKLNENGLKRYYEPKPGLFVAESPNVILRALQAGYEPESFLVSEAELEKLPDSFWTCAKNAPVYTAPTEVLQTLAGFELTRGVLAALHRKKLPTAEAIAKNAKRVVVLEEVMNPTNVGAIFRSAAALGMDAVLLTSGCADPLYRRAARVSMGNVFLIPWTCFEKKEDAQALLKEWGYTTVAMALCEDSISLRDERLCKPDKLAVFMGTEGDGLKAATISGCDYTVKIPMAYGVDSLNVAAAAAVAFYALGKDKA